MNNGTFLLLQGPDERKYLAQEVGKMKTVYCSCSYYPGKWLVTPFPLSGWVPLSRRSVSSDWWEQQEKDYWGFGYGWERAPGRTYFNLDFFTVLAEAEGEANPHGIFRV